MEGKAQTVDATPSNMQHTRLTSQPLQKAKFYTVDIMTHGKYEIWRKSTALARSVVVELQRMYIQCIIIVRELIRKSLIK